jgi:3D (Asp-Asp-Asp) domain-containing protein
MRRLAALGLLVGLLLPTPAQAATPWQRIFVTGYDNVGRTATGTWARWGEVAVDPRVVPLGAWVEIKPYRTIFRAEDTGGLVQGRHIDIFFPTAAQCFAATGWKMARWSWRKADLHDG